VLVRPYDDGSLSEGKVFGSGVGKEMVSGEREKLNWILPHLYTIMYLYISFRTADVGTVGTLGSKLV
jgi:hypothetical protein